MGVIIKAVFENGIFRPLQPVDLPEGKEVEIAIQQTEDERLRAALGDSVSWPDPNYAEDAELEDQAEEIARAFSGDIPLSQYVIEDRDEDQRLRAALGDLVAHWPDTSDDSDA